MTKKQIVEYIEKALKSFETDNADTDYQRGYEAALRELWRVIQQD